MGLIDDVRPGPVALDTAPFVYLIQEHPRYLAVVRPVFAAIAAGTLSAITSALTLLETLVLPYRLGNTALAERYEALLTRSRGLRLDEITRDVCRAAAHLRAAYGVKTPDALQLATALVGNCSAFLTNDRDLPALPSMRILQVKDYCAA